MKPLILCASALLSLAAFAAPSMAALKSHAAPAKTYRASCGMTFTAAQAKKDHYICPMNHSKMVLITPKMKHSK